MRLHSLARSRTGRSLNRGVTLVELMVGLTIGLILVIIASAIYLYAKQSYNAVSENSQMEENGRYAIDVLTKAIQNAGFAVVDPKAPGPTLPLSGRISACAYGYTKASAPTSMTDLACRTATPAGERQSATFFTRYETDLPASASGKQQGFDCTNAAAPSKQVSNTGMQTYEVRSYFFVSQVNATTPYGVRSMGQLGCVSDATPTVDGTPVGAAVLRVQPLVPGIEQVVLQPISSTGQVIALPTTTAGWDAVAAIDLCVLARTIQSSGNDVRTGYTDCYGADFTATRSDTYRTYRSTVALRNQDLP